MIIKGTNLKATIDGRSFGLPILESAFDPASSPGKGGSISIVVKHSGSISIKGYDLKKRVYELFFYNRKMGLEIYGLKFLGKIEGIMLDLRENEILDCILYLTRWQRIIFFVYGILTKLIQGRAHGTT